MPTADPVAQLRSLHRIVTERAGALQARFLGLDRPYGESRVLWEVGLAGAEVRELRRRLALDSGYLSRLLRSLEAAGLVVVGRSGADGRVRVAQLTAAGRREQQELDRRSDRLAVSILDPLEPEQREQLAAAAATVERLLTASLVEIAIADPRTADARWCIRRYFEELVARFERGFDPAASNPLEEDELAPPHGLFLVARLRGKPVGCGALRHRGGGHTDVKRMWVDPTVRGLGLGRRLLRELEGRASAAGASVVQLETNGALLEAIELYRSAGYEEVPAFNDEPYGEHWFRKHLADPES